MARMMAKAKNARWRHFPPVMPSRSLVDDRRLHDVVELGKARGQVRVPFILNADLLRTGTLRPILGLALPIAGVERVDDVHALHDFPQRPISNRVETAVVRIVD